MLASFPISGKKRYSQFFKAATTVLANTLIQMNEGDSRSNGFSAVNTEEICAVTPALALASSPEPF